MKRIYVNLTDELAAVISAKAGRTGLRQAEIIRRALNYALHSAEHSFDAEQAEQLRLENPRAFAKLTQRPLVVK